MARYTTELRTICESLTGNQLGAYTQTQEIIEGARTQIFDFDYPIYNQEYKAVLETKIIRHYYTQEIGCETVGLWKFRLETKLNEIMPYFNKLYESADLKYDILHDYLLEKIHYGDSQQESQQDQTGSKTGTTSGTSSEDTTNNLKVGGTDTTDFNTNGLDQRNTTNDSTVDITNKTMGDNRVDGRHETAFSDTPQGSLSGVDNLTYLTNFTSVVDDVKTTDDVDVTGKQTTGATGTDDLTYSRDDKTTVKYGRTEDGTGSKSGTTSGTSKEDTTGSSTGTVNTTDKYVEQIKGKLGGRLYPEMVQAYRDTLINIDMMIIRELRSLFMLIY